jgi:S-adenosyl methyltransferase
VISHPAKDVRPAAMAELTRRVNARLGSARGTMRDRAAITGFFDALVLAEPGVVQPQQWWPAARFPRRRESRKGRLSRRGC